MEKQTLRIPSIKAATSSASGEMFGIKREALAAPPGGI